MSSHSPQQRNRKTQSISIAPATMQSITIPREASPSPSFRERQRTIKAHSMPIVPSVGQILSSATQQQQPSPTISNPPPPPPTSRISPVTAKLAPGSHVTTSARERSPERLNSPPPPLIHAHSQPVVSQLVSSVGQPQSNVLAHHPRPINRVPPPPFLSQYQSPEEKWHITEELMADFERADQQGQLQGTSGVAYAGGAASSTVHLQHTIANVAVERVRVNDRSSPKDSDNSAKRLSQKEPSTNRESPKTRERSQTTSSVVAPRVEQEISPQDRSEFRASPYQTPMASPGERTAAYTQYIPDAYQQATNSSAPRKSVPSISADAIPPRSTPPGGVKAANQSPPLQPVTTRPPDRSLPVQEEPEEDVGHDAPNGETDYLERRSPMHSPDHYAESHSPRYDSHRPHRNGTHISGDDDDDDDDDDETLNEAVDSSAQQDKSGDDDDAAFTPRSPSTNLPERSREAPYNATNGQYLTTASQYAHPSADSEQKTVRAAKHRSARTDHLGMRGFDPALFEHTVSNLRTNPQDGVQRQQSPPQTQTAPRSETQSQQSHYHLTNGQYTNRAAGQTAYGSSASLPPMSTPLENLFDDPTSSYLQNFFQSGNRPKAPIPPTPQSNTAAPSPSPAISAMQGEPGARQVGSPYPYPFTHIRRTALSAAQVAPSSSFDHNNPALVREQLALQMQIYALNNGLAAPSDSTFSPSSTPFPGPGYNPWALMYQAAHEGDSSMSMRSSPSHEPIPMPTLPMRGHGGLRRRGHSTDLRVQGNGNPGKRRIKPPPRVESTQPRETSPEPSSGEETAGEERFADQYTPHDVVWADGGEVAAETEEAGEWIDENDDGEDDLLQLEYHPTYVTRADKRKRRWETRWDALVQAFQALDRETDTTLVLLAAPPHTSKMHAMMSRSIRRDSALLKSEGMYSMRSSFNQLASQRKATRARRFSLADHLSSAHSHSSADGSQAGGETREEDLRRALEAALGSLGALGTLYEQRESRWREEMRRLSDDREHVELLLRQALGPALANGHAQSS